MLASSALALVLCLSAAPKGAPAKSAAPVPAATVAAASGGVREVLLDPSKKLVAPEVRLAPAIAATLTFPEPWVSNPACGDCQYGDMPNAQQLWRLDVDPTTNAISLKFIGQPTSAMLTDPPVTNVNLQLESGLFVSLIVTLTLDIKQSDLRIDFRLPAGAGGKERLTAKERELEAGFSVRVAEAASKELLQALVAGTKCRDFAGGPRRADDLVVRMQQICANARYVYATFEVENRQRADLALLSATFTSAAGATNVETRGDGEVPVVYFEKTTLRFNEKTKGIAAIPLLDNNLPPTTYSLIVQEDGGKARKVTIDGIESSGGCSSAGPGTMLPFALVALLWRRRHRAA